MIQYKYTPDELKSLFISIVENGTRHKHYDRTVDYAKFCEKIMTGEGQDELIVSYKPRETDEQKQQRISITNSRTKFIAGKVYGAFAEVERADNVIKKLNYASDDDATKSKIAEIKQRLDVFHSNNSLEKYLHEAVRHLNFYDPNAFVLVEMHPHDPIKGKPYTYPVEVYSEQAYNYERHNGVLQYIVVEHITKHDKQNLSKFTMYAPDVAFVLEELPFGSKREVLEGQEKIEMKRGGKSHFFVFEAFETKSKICPAVQVGYIKDAKTNRETFVSPLDPAEHLFLDVINTKSEYDLARALHGFVQKFAYADDCQYQEYEKDFIDTCRSGTMTSGGTCPKCEGTGLMFHTSVQDIILRRMPDGKDEHIPLSQMVHFVEIPESIIDRWKKDLKELETDIGVAIFNTDTFDRSEIAATATEKRLDLRNVHNTLAAFAANECRIYKHCALITAVHTQNDEGLQIERKYPDFNVETVAELLARRATAIAANAPYPIVNAIDAVIIEKQASGDRDSVAKIQAWERHKPFKSKSEAERMFILAQLPYNSFEVVLWTYFDEICTDVEMASPLPFHLISFEGQKEMIKAVVDVRIAALPDPVTFREVEI